MLKRPRTLSYFSFFLLGVAASLPFQIMWLNGHSLSEWQTVLVKISLVNWVVIAFTLCTAICIFRASPRTKYFAPLTALAVAFNNIVVGSQEAGYSPLIATMATFGFAASHLLLFQHPLIELFQNPEKRWWLRPPRLNLDITVFVNPLNGTAFRSKTFDISETGVFISQQPGALKMPALAIDERLSICLTLGQWRQLRCDARVVRQSGASGRYPDGLALTFEGLGRTERRELHKFITSRAA